MHRLSALTAGALLLAAGACAPLPYADTASGTPVTSADAWTRCATLPDGEHAIFACRAVVRAEPKSLAGRRALAERLEALDRHREALQAREAIVRLAPEDASAVLDLAQAQERAGRSRDALRSYERFAELAPDEPRAHELVGWMQLELGHHEAALEAFDRATAQRRATASAHYGAAIALTSMYRRREAMQSLWNAIQRDSTRAEYWGQLAVNAFALGMVDEAAQHWSRAIALAPDYFDRRSGERRQWEEARLRATALAGASAAEGDRGRVRADSSGAPPAATADRTGAAATNANGAAGRTAGVVVPPRRRSLVVGPDASGSGFMITRAGHVVTNKHVVRACRSVQVRVGESSLHPADVLAVDPDDDLALLKVGAPLPSAVTFRDEPALRAGEDVVATGYPLNGLLADEVNVTAGIVSALAGMRNDRHVLQMTAPVQPGSSGGPLFDASGNLVGVVVTKLNARIVEEETGDIPQNVNFAVKATVLRDFLDQSGIDYRVGVSSTARARADIGDIGREVTVLVQCFR